MFVNAPLRDAQLADWYSVGDIPHRNFRTNYNRADYLLLTTYYLHCCFPIPTNLSREIHQQAYDQEKSHAA